jgi:UDP-glucose 4-epimerase
MNILLTNVAGYIASHTAVVLAQAGRETTLFDNFSNSSLSAIQGIERITDKAMNFIEGDVRDTKLLSEVIRKNKIEAVFHFAGLKSVGGVSH